jgi:hypothetical protein
MAPYLLVTKARLPPRESSEINVLHTTHYTRIHFGLQYCGVCVSWVNISPSSLARALDASTNIDHLWLPRSKYEARRTEKIDLCELKGLHTGSSPDNRQQESRWAGEV